MMYLGEIISLAVFVVIVLAGCAGLYLIVRSRHRKWEWEDQVHQNTMRRELMNEMDIEYEVDEKGFVTPKAVHRSTRN